MLCSLSSAYHLATLRRPTQINALKALLKERTDLHFTLLVGSILQTSNFSQKFSSLNTYNATKPIASHHPVKRSLKE
jgi:hypothetical protein